MLAVSSTLSPVQKVSKGVLYCAQPDIACPAKVPGCHPNLRHAIHLQIALQISQFHLYGTLDTSSDGLAAVLGLTGMLGA